MTQRPSPPSPKAPRFVDVFLAYLKAEGARDVFGIPGGLLHPFFEALEQDPGFRLIVTKHEEGAAFMADGQARVTRELSVCAGTAGPGATNLLTGVSCAFADGVPLLVLTGQAASHSLGKGAAQESTREDMDIVAMFKPVTKYSAMITEPGALSLHLRRALRLALTGRPGPVHLNVPVDLWEKPLSEDWFRPSTYRPHTRVFDRDKVREAADALLAASRPLILAGSGVGIAGAEIHLLNLAEIFPARVCTTPRAKGLFPEDHPLSLGILGLAGHEAARHAVLGDEVDVLLSLGASLNETTTFNWHQALMPENTFIQAEIDPDRIGRNYPVDIPLVGDAQTILVELLYHVHRRIREGIDPSSTWPSAKPPPRGEDRYSDPGLRRAEGSLLGPARWRAELMKAIPRGAIVFSDIGGHMLFNLHHLEIGSGSRFVLNLGFGSMGHGTVAPIGAALALPETPILTIVGDGCFTMNGMELLTAAEYEVPVVWIVENNQMHGITWHGSQLVGSRKPMSSIVYQRRIEIAAIARAMGLRSWVVERPGEIEEVVREAIGAREPCVIEVRVDGSVAPPLGERAKTIAGFTD